MNLERLTSRKLSPEGEYAVLVENSVRLRLRRGYHKQLESRVGVNDLS